MLSNLHFDISLQTGTYICSTAKENHKKVFQLLQRKIRAEATSCFAGNLNLLLTQTLSQANHNALDLLKGPEEGSLLVWRFFLDGGREYFLATSCLRGDLTYGKSGIIPAPLIRSLYLYKAYTQRISQMGKAASPFYCRCYNCACKCCLWHFQLLIRLTNQALGCQHGFPAWNNSSTDSALYSHPGGQDAAKRQKV